MKESYGHVSINQSSDDYMVMMDLVDDSFSSVYDDYSEKK
jgi:oxalate decarboxylase/phosphoglucose isomerase-like protein (cupin superfamily)